MDTYAVIATPAEREAERNSNIDWADYPIKEIEPRDDRGYTITVGEPLRSGSGRGWGGWTGNLRWREGLPEPHVGDVIRCWTEGASLQVGHSLWVNGHLVPIDYRTERERQAQWGYEVVSRQIRQREEFENGGRVELDALYETLPLPLKRRLDRFRAEDPGFRWREESYEMAACAEAGRLYRAAMEPATGELLKANGIKIGADNVKPWNQPKGEGSTDWEDTPENRLKAIDAINGAPNNYDFKLLERLFPWIDRGHSGNTWGHAMAFARLLLKDGDEAQL